MKVPSYKKKGLMPNPREIHTERKLSKKKLLRLKTYFKNCYCSPNCSLSPDCCAWGWCKYHWHTFNKCNLYIHGLSPVFCCPPYKSSAVYCYMAGIKLNEISSLATANQISILGLNSDSFRLNMDKMTNNSYPNSNGTRIFEQSPSGLFWLLQPQASESEKQLLV